MSDFTNELDVALSVADGTLPSPTRWFNADYVALRISGTGTAWRPAVQEMVHRAPELWLSDEMRRRCLGLPVVISHPPTSVLTSQYFGAAVVGIVVLAFVKNDELWSVARILDSEACRLIAEGQFDTSPGIVLPPDGAGTFVGVGGDVRCLVEEAPALLDHVALIWTGDGNKGVWTRDGTPGIELTSDETEKGELQNVVA